MYRERAREILILVGEQFWIIETIGRNSSCSIGGGREMHFRRAVCCGDGEGIFGEIQNTEQLPDALIGLPLLFIHSKSEFFERFRSEFFH